MEEQLEGRVKEQERTKEKYKKLGEKILIVSRNELYLSMRFLDSALGSLSYEMNQNTFFVGTDGMSLFYNPRFLMERYGQHPVIVNRSYLHMILHAMFRHIWHREEREEEYWNTACDIVVESIIDGMESRAVKRLIPDKREEIYKEIQKFQKVFTAEGVYQYLTTAPLTWKEFTAISTEFLVDDHSFWKREEGENGEGDSSEQQGEEQKEQQKLENKEDRQHSDQNTMAKEQKWQKITEQMKTNMETFRKQAGNEAGSLLKALKVETRIRQDFRTFLKQFAVVREEMQVDMDSFDYGFYHFGMEFYGNMPLIEELEYKEVAKIEEFVIAIDTSGSCSGAVVEAFLREAFSILKDTENFFHKVNIHIIQCDMEVKEDICISNQEELDTYLESFAIKGYGGTDFRPVFEYVRTLQEQGELKRLKGLLYFTDGYGVYPKKRTDYDTVFVFPEQDYFEQDVPPWAMKLVLSEEQLFSKKEKRG